MPRTATWEDYRQRIHRVTAHLERNLEESSSLDELAGIAAFSPFHFHRVFRAVTGEGVAEYSRRLRLERAARRLKTSDRPVVDIAFEAGYEAHESFTRAFDNAFGVAPSTYRAAHGLAGNIDVTQDRIGPLHLVQIRHTGPYENVGATFARLATWMGPRALFGPWTRAVGRSFDDPEITDPARLRYFAAFVVPRPVAAEGDVEYQELEPRDFVCAVHRGPYPEMSRSYAALIRTWVQRGGRQISDGPSLEFYLNTPDSTPPHALETRICLPLD